MNSADLRILEIGQFSLIKRGLPAQTRFIFTGPGEPGGEDEVFGLRVLRSLRRERFDLVVCHATSYPLWTREFPLLRNLLTITRRALRDRRSLGVYALKNHTRTPLAVLDLHDPITIQSSNFFLLRQCRAWFKLSLPVDLWDVFILQQIPARAREKPFFKEAASKLRPISLGIDDGKLDEIGTPDGEKTTDIFFAGDVASSSIRAAGLPELDQLERQGFTVDRPAEPLPRAEFLRRCARAWIVWSPAGQAWDCFRHYEAAACASVPLMSHPTIRRHAPLIAGEHCYFYEVRTGELTRVAADALRDKPRLRGMGLAAREHVLRHHTHRALTDHVVSHALGL